MREHEAMLWSFLEVPEDLLEYGEMVLGRAVDESDEVNGCEGDARPRTISRYLRSTMRDWNVIPSDLESVGEGVAGSKSNCLERGEVLVLASRSPARSSAFAMRVG